MSQNSREGVQVCNHDTVHRGNLRADLSVFKRGIETTGTDYLLFERLYGMSTAEARRYTGMFFTTFPGS